MTPATNDHAPGIHVGPDPDDRLEAAVREGGGRVVGPDEAVGVVFHSAADDPAESVGLVTDRTRWVQLPHAGVERWTSNGLITTDPVWTSAAGAYGPQVAEHAFALMLAGAQVASRPPRGRRPGTGSRGGCSRAAPSRSSATAASAGACCRCWSRSAAACWP